MSNETVKLTTLGSEVEAALLVQALANEGIDAAAAGGLTAGFRAEAPGGVLVLVRVDDLVRAEIVLKGFRDEAKNIDWDQVDVGERVD